MEVLPPFDHLLRKGKNCAVGKLVLIPADKYKAFAKSDSNGREGFMGWVGMILAYENSRTKLKVKIHEDVGLEHLDIKNGVFAINNLTRLI